MPFRLCYASMTFQHALYVILSDTCRRVCLVYFSKIVNDRIKNLNTRQLLLRDAGKLLKLCKCSFARPPVEYQEHVIFAGKLAISDTGIDRFPNFEFSCLLRDLHSFQRGFNVNRRIIKSFEAIEATQSAYAKRR